MQEEVFITRSIAFIRLRYIIQNTIKYHVCDILDFPKCVSTRLMMFYLARKHCVNYDLEVIYCETASHKLKQKRKSLSFILKRNRDYLSSFVLLLWPNKRSTVWKLIESPTKRKHFCSYIFSPIRYLYRISGIARKFVCLEEWNLNSSVNR